MKQHKLNNLIEDLQHVKMTREEKSEVLARSWSAIAKIESAHQFSIGTGRVVEVGKHSTSIASTFQTAWYSYFLEKKFVPALSFAILLLATGGTSLAAESALPGDLLYPIKLGLNEQVRGFTAVTPEAKAKFALEVTDRRLKEVAILSSKGLLNAETSSIIQGQLLKQAGQITNQVASLVSTKNIRAAQEISLNFESSLRAHELILEKISSKQVIQAGHALALASSTASSTDEEASTTIASTEAPALTASIQADATHIASLIATIKAQIATTTAARAMLQAVEAGDNSLDKTKLLARLAEIKLKTVEIKRIANTTPISSSVRLSTSLSYITEADSLIASASLKIASSSYSDALVDLQKASQFLIDAETLISAEYSSDPALNSVINEALDLNFSQLDTSSTTASSTLNMSTTTTTVTETGTVSTETASSSSASTTPSN